MVVLTLLLEQTTKAWGMADLLVLPVQNHATEYITLTWVIKSAILPIMMKIEIHAHCFKNGSIYASRY